MFYYLYLLDIFVFLNLYINQAFINCLIPMTNLICFLAPNETPYLRIVSFGL
jgi:hypothetical protein